MRNHTAVCFGVMGMAAMTAGCLSDISISRRYSNGKFHDESPDPRASAPVPTMSVLDFGPTTHQADPPPPISGGTLAISSNAHTAVAADPDRDAVYLVDLKTKVVRTVNLDRHDEPGRVTLDDASGRAYVALRHGGAIVAIDLATAKVTARVATCPMPRGIAWDANAALVRVVCAGGEIVTMAAGLVGAPETTRIEGFTDLRDVVVRPDGGVYVSTFRSAEVKKLGPSAKTILPGEVVPHRTSPLGIRRVAWRVMAVAAPPVPPENQPDELVMIAQIAGSTVVETPAEYYGQDNNPQRNGAHTVVTIGGSEAVVNSAVLPVDVAVSPQYVAIVSAGNTHLSNSAHVILIDRPDPASPTFSTDNGRTLATPSGQLTSIAFTPSGDRLVALSREPARLFVLNPASYDTTSSGAIEIELSAIVRKDTGHDIFHANSGAGMACASCHPEGRDDGHAWTSTELGARRTPSLIGTVANTSPYHWNGEATSMNALAKMTFSTRMLGPQLAYDQLNTLGEWLVALPALAASPAIDVASASRGKALFESSAKCSVCHTGSAFTNNSSIDVKTGGFFQVPSLVGVSHRAPYLHDGTAPSLSYLLTSRQHHGSTLTIAEVTDLSAFLETL